AVATGHASAAACGARVAGGEGIWQVARELRPAALDSVCWRLVLGEVLLGLLVGAGRRVRVRRVPGMDHPGREWLRRKQAKWLFGGAVLEKPEPGACPPPATPQPAPLPHAPR